MEAVQVRHPPFVPRSSRHRPASSRRNMRKGRSPGEVGALHPVLSLRCRGLDIQHPAVIEQTVGGRAVTAARGQPAACSCIFIRHFLTLALPKDRAFPPVRQRRSTSRCHPWMWSIDAHGRVAYPRCRCGNRHWHSGLPPCKDSKRRTSRRATRDSRWMGDVVAGTRQHSRGQRMARHMVLIQQVDDRTILDERIDIPRRRGAKIRGDDLCSRSFGSAGIDARTA